VTPLESPTRRFNTAARIETLLPDDRKFLCAYETIKGVLNWQKELLGTLKPGQIKNSLHLSLIVNEYENRPKIAPIVQGCATRSEFKGKEPVAYKRARMVRRII
jgi:hypothetical protein